MTLKQLKQFLEDVEAQRLKLNQPIGAVMDKAAVSRRSWYEWKRGQSVPNPYQAMKLDAALSRLAKREKPLSGRDGK